MALRLLTYLGLLYQDLQKSGALLSDGKLPPVLPLVFNICFLKKAAFLWIIYRHIILSALTLPYPMAEIPGTGTIRRAFTVWINRVLLPVRLPGQEVPHVNNLLEVETMLAERVKEWTKEWKEEGMQKGMQKGTKKINKILCTQLTQRFGSLPQWATEKINNTDMDTLEKWSLRLLSADELDEIFH